jgi:uncharacterized protein (TIGR02231 family)
VQVPSARWRTAYLLRLPNVTEGLLYVQRWAEIQNKTGIDWKNVQLTLSTALPSQAAEAPPFQPWYVDLYGEIRAFTRASGAAKEDGEYFAPEPDEGAEKENPPLPVESNVLLARTYTLGTHTIPTGENTVRLLLKEDTFSVQPFFLVNGPATPKAYMRAALPLSVMRLSDEGEARIEVEGQPVGRLRWPPRTKEDTLWLDLGPTERLVVSREEIERRRETTLAGGIARYLFTYRLSVASTYERPVRVVVWDRIPVSRHSDIKVDLTDSGKGTVDAETGRLSWTITLEPGQRWETTFRFTVRAPKGKAILGL